ncbi:MAG: hypothetical protein ACHQVS_00050 [Candidatus Babeliales bacterium]
MKKIAGIVLGFCITYAANMHADCSSFNQRFGVNGYLTSLPLYYKGNEFYKQYKNKDKRTARKKQSYRKNHKDNA